MKYISFCLLAGALFTPPSFAEETCPSPELESFQGSVSLSRETESGKTEAQPVQDKDLPVEAGAHVLTGPGSWADVRLCDGSVIRVGESSDFKVEPAVSRAGFWQSAFHLLEGSILASISSGESDHVKLTVRTRTAAMGIRGTEFVVDVRGEETELHTLKGEVLLGPVSEIANLIENRIDPSRIAPVRSGFASSLRQGDRRPRKPEAFDAALFNRKRPDFLMKPFTQSRAQWLQSRPQARSSLVKAKAGKHGKHAKSALDSTSPTAPMAPTAPAAPAAHAAPGHVAPETGPEGHPRK